MDKNELIKRIKASRKLAKLTAKQLSLNINKNAMYITRLENDKGKNFPSTKTFFQIIEACDIPLDKFFYYNIDEYDRDKHLMNLLKHFRPEIKDVMAEVFRRLK